AAQDDIDVEEPRGEQHGTQQTCERTLSQEGGGAACATFGVANFRVASFRLATFRRRVGPSRSNHGVLPLSRYPARTPHIPQRPALVLLGSIVKMLGVISRRLFSGNTGCPPR